MTNLCRNIALAVGGVVCAAAAFVRMSRRMNFEGKTVVIMGGSRGLGLELARIYGNEGARLALVARDEEELKRARFLLGTEKDVFTFVCDVSSPTETKNTIQLIEETCGPIDVLVNNAGQIQSGPLETQDFSDFKQLMKLHFWAPLYAIDAVLPSMKERKAGRIVNVSSIGGLISVPHLLPYCASKHALVGLSRGLRSELSKFGILTTTVCPTLMRTGSHVNAEFKGNTDAEYTLFSLLDTLPFTSIDSQSAAKQIVEACRFGDANLIISIPAKIANMVEAIAPNVVNDFLAFVDRFLPGAGDAANKNAIKGKDINTKLSPSILTRLGDLASLRNNELPVY